MAEKAVAAVLPPTSCSSWKLTSISDAAASRRGDPASRRRVASVAVIDVKMTWLRRGLTRRQETRKQQQPAQERRLPRAPRLL